MLPTGLLAQASTMQDAKQRKQGCSAPVHGPSFGSLDMYTRV